MERRHTPGGIVMLSVLALSAGLWRFIVSCYALWFSIRLILFGGAVGREASAGFDLMCLGMFGLLLALAGFAVADALFNLRSWAWQLGIILGALNVLFAGLEVIVALIDPVRGSFPWSAIIGLGINGLLLWYLVQPDICATFAARGAAAEEPGEDR
ncbi:MAG: hypothetical protein JXB47_12435 [Anaerolineae bacterium]|nr:hypothetical protein [Anaerolineae bacterium]